MSLKAIREMRVQEKALISKMLVEDFPGRDDLSMQLETAKVQVLDDNGSLGFHLDDNVTASSVKYAVPTEGEYEDSDGVTVHMLLFVVKGKAKELELYREDNGRVQKWPDPNDLCVFAPE